MEFSRLLKALKVQGYKGDKPEPDAIKAFIAEKNLSFLDSDTGAEVDVDAVCKAANKRKVVIDQDDEVVDDDKSVVEKAREIVKEAQKANRGTGRPGDPEDAPQRFSVGNMERKNFNAKAARGETFLADADVAELFGAWSRLALHSGKNRSYTGKKEDEAICRKANVAYDFASGGFSMPEILRNEMIWIREKYSILDMICPSIPIDIAGESIPRSASEMTVYSPGEGVAMTESNPTGDQVGIKPFEMTAYSTASRKVMMGSVFNWGDWIAQKMLYAINKKEEQIFFLGDGSSTYFNQQGLIGKYNDLVVDAGGTWTTNAEYAAAAVRAAGNAWSEITDANLDSLLGQPGDLENNDLGSSPIVCHRRFFYQVMIPLMKSKGGVTIMEMANGVRVPSYGGHPVLFSNALPKVEANGSVVAHFGNFGMGIKRGVVPESFLFESNDNVAWTSNRIAWKLTTHRALTVHDVGDANSTASSRNPGPTSFLITAES